MKIERLVISYNKYNFEHEGVPPESYGAKVDLVGWDGRLVAPLSVDMVDRILNLAAPEVVDFVHGVIRDTTASNMIERGAILEHKDAT